MVASAKRAEEAEVALPGQLVYPDVQHTADTQELGTTTTAARQPQKSVSRKDRPPPPKCMQSCITSIESCTQNVVRFNERMEQSRTQADARREEYGDPAAARKAIIQ